MMALITSVEQVFEGIQRAKGGASAFCTNFFPVRDKIKIWLEHHELRGEIRDGAALFLRKDNKCSHVYFCAGSPALLNAELAKVEELKREPVTADLIGNEEGLEMLSGALKQSGFRHYSRLMRLARMAQSEVISQQNQVDLAEPTDAPAIIELLEAAFDPYADQLPMRYEIDSAIANRQIFTIKHAGHLAALLFFETQGLTSSIRYWAVAGRFRAHGYGSALIRHYFLAHNTVSRFILWVTAKNENAVQKYQHYGYAPDGLVDEVLVNEIILK